MAQFARPDADVLTTGWTNTASPYYSNVDEVTPNGTDVVQSNSVSSGTTNSIGLSLSSVGHPGVLTGRTLRIRALRSNANRTMAGHYALYQGASLVQMGQFAAGLLNTGFTQYSVSITEPITDYTDLIVYVWGVASGGTSGTTAIRLDHIEFEVPNADTTAPTVTITAGPTRTRMSRQAGADSTDITFESNEAFTAYQVRVVPNSGSAQSAGTLLESGGAGAANTPVVVTVTDDELVAASAVEGSNVLKVFTQDAAGNWSA